MNLDAVENLSQEDIQKLFDDIVENNELIGGCICYYGGRYQPLARGSRHVSWGIENFIPYCPLDSNSCSYSQVRAGDTLNQHGGCELNLNSKSVCQSHCSATGGSYTHSTHWDATCYCRGTKDLRTWSTCDD